MVPALGCSSGSTPASSNSDFHPLGCRCSDCYIRVDRPPQPLTALKGVKGLLRSVRSGKSFNGLKPVRMKLFSPLQTTSSAAATALQQNTSVLFNGSFFPEKTDIALVYDEGRVLNIKVHYTLILPALGTNHQVTYGALSIEFDPTVTAPTAMEQLLQSSFNSGPTVLSGGAGSYAGGVQSIRPTPFNILSGKPPSPLSVVNSADCVGNAWFTLSTDSPAIFQWRGYFSALPAAAGVIQIACIYELDMEFRMRT